MKNQTLFIAMLVAAGLTKSRGQDVWMRKANFGGAERNGAVGFSIGSKGYLGTGLNGPLLKDFWEYDPATNVWTQKADFGGTGRVWATGFSIGSKGYLGTGVDGPGVTRKDFWEYDPATNVWTQKADFGGQERANATGFSAGGKGYIGTGSSVFGIVFYFKDFWEYDPATNAWTQKADFGGAERPGAVGFSIGSKGYIGTGVVDNFSQPVKDFWEYDPVTNAWTQKADVGGSERLFGVGFSIGQKGYVGNGYNFVNFLKDLWEYDPTTNAWTQKADFAGRGAVWQTGFSTGQKAYIGTGTPGNGRLLKEFWEYTPEGAAAYRDVILADNPIMYWRLGETCGTIAYDETANHRDAMYIHHPSLGQPGAIANDGNTSVGFNGCNQWAGWRPTSSYSGAFTVEAWVKVKEIQRIQTFFDSRTETAEYSFDFKLDTLLRKEIRMDVGDGTQWLSTSGVRFDFKRNVWYYVAAVVTRTGATCYVDGSAIGSVTYKGVPLLFDVAHNVEIGTNTRYDSEWFDGAIDEVAVYDYPLSADQVAAHYSTGIGN